MGLLTDAGADVLGVVIGSGIGRGGNLGAASGKHRVPILALPVCSPLPNVFSFVHGVAVTPVITSSKRLLDFHGGAFKLPVIVLV